MIATSSLENSTASEAEERRGKKELSRGREARMYQGKVWQSAASGCQNDSCHPCEIDKWNGEMQEIHEGKTWTVATCEFGEESNLRKDTVLYRPPSEAAISFRESDLFCLEIHCTSRRTPCWPRSRHPSPCLKGGVLPWGLRLLHNAVRNSMMSLPEVTSCCSRSDVTPL